MADEKNSVGRPQANLNLPDGWEATVLELYQQGASDVEIKAQIIEWRGSISNSLWNRWMKEEKKFSTTVKRGRILSAAWWEKKGRLNIDSKEFNSGLWFMNMKNRFGWADKKEIDHRSKGKAMASLPAPSFFITPGEVLDEIPVTTNGNGKGH